MLTFSLSNSLSQPFTHTVRSDYNLLHPTLFTRGMLERARFPVLIFLMGIHRVHLLSMGNHLHHNPLLPDKSAYNPKALSYSASARRVAQCYDPPFVQILISPLAALPLGSWGVWSHPGVSLAIRDTFLTETSQTSGSISPCRTFTPPIKSYPNISAPAYNIN